MWNEYHLCEGIEEALHLLQQYDGDAKVIAGGTDLMLKMKVGAMQVPALIDITRIRELQKISVQDDHICIGAAVTFRQIINSGLIIQFVPHLITAARAIAGRQIRNVATIAGNIVNASPSADSAPVLYTLNAKVHFIDELMSKHVMPIAQFIEGVSKTALPKCGLVTMISFPILGDGWHTSFRKLGLRRSMAISLVNTSVALLEKEGVIQEARIAFGSVAPTPVRSSAAEEALVGLPLNGAFGSEAPRLARSSVLPIDDFRASATYRLQMVENILREELLKMTNTEH